MTDEPKYVRFREPPEGGRSRNWVTGVFESGVSVFEGSSRDGLFEISAGRLTRGGTMVLMAYAADDVPAFFVEGEGLGRGTSGEPLLRPSSWRPVPEATRLTSSEPSAEEALARWSEGNRDLYGGKRRLTRWRLLHNPGYWPPKDSVMGHIHPFPGTREALDPAAPFVEDPAGDPETLVRAVRLHATLPSRRSHIHGPRHWLRVHEHGMRLCEQTPGADPHVVALFAALHDCARDNDGRDPRHGRYGAKTGVWLWHGGEDGLFSATPKQMHTLVEACDRHDEGGVSDDPTIGVCWDADRLDLVRLKRKVNPKFLSTEVAKASLQAHEDGS